MNQINGVSKAFDECVRHLGLSYSELKDAGVLAAWEIAAIESGKFGNLRVSTIENVAAYADPDRVVNKKDVAYLAESISKLIRASIVGMYENWEAISTENNPAVAVTTPNQKVIYLK